MPLRGSKLEDLRADVFDALFRARLTRDDTEEDLLKARQAVLLLMERRSLIAQAQLNGEAALPAVARGPGRPLVAELVAAYEDQAA